MNPAVEIAPERRDEIISKVAGWVSRKRLETPAILMIEMNRPLATLGANAFHFGAPLLGPVFGERFLADAGVMLEDRDNVDRLVAEIERVVRERDAAAADGAREEA